jgi:hypothetical protein
MTVCNCTGKCKAPPYTCSGTTEPVTVTASICIHGVMNGNACHLCTIAGQAASNFISLKTGVNWLSDRHARQVDENRKVSGRLDDLEERVKRLEEIYKNISYMKERIPYRCPICDGTGYWKKIENHVACGGRCHSCDGKGIVWS